MKTSINKISKNYEKVNEYVNDMQNKLCKIIINKK